MGHATTVSSELWRCAARVEGLSQRLLMASSWSTNAHEEPWDDTSSRTTVPVVTAHVPEVIIRPLCTLTPPPPEVNNTNDEILHMELAEDFTVDWGAGQHHHRRKIGSLRLGAVYVFQVEFCVGRALHHHPQSCRATLRSAQCVSSYAELSALRVLWSDNSSRPLIADQWIPSKLQYCVDLWCTAVAGQRAAKELLILIAMYARLFTSQESCPLHVLLVGGQGCGKSSLLRSVNELFGDDHSLQFGGNTVPVQRTGKRRARVFHDRADVMPSAVKAVGAGHNNDNHDNKVMWMCGALLSSHVILIDDIHQAAKLGARASFVSDVLDPSGVRVHLDGFRCMASSLETSVRMQSPSAAAAAATAAEKSPWYCSVSNLVIASANLAACTPQLAQRFSLVAFLGSVSEAEDHVSITEKTVREASARSAQRLSSEPTTVSAATSQRSRSSSCQSSYGYGYGRDSWHSCDGASSPSFREGIIQADVSDVLDQLASVLHHRNDTHGHYDDAQQDVSLSLLEARAYHSLLEHFSRDVAMTSQLLVQINAHHITTVAHVLARFVVARYAFDPDLELETHCVTDILRLFLQLTSLPQSATSTVGEPVDGSARKRGREQGDTTPALLGQRKLSKKQCARNFIQLLRRVPDDVIPVGTCRALFQQAFIGGNGAMFEEIIDQLSHDGFLIKALSGFRLTHSA